MKAKFTMPVQSHAHALWKAGVGLSQAAYNFGPEDLKHQYSLLCREVDGAQSGVTAAEIQKRVAETTYALEAITVFVDSYKPLMNLSSEKGEVWRALQSSLLRELQSGGVSALGYFAPRSPEAVPTDIPEDVWAGKVDWSLSAIEGNGLQFVAVRVFQNQSPDALAPPPKKAGRKGTKREVFEAYSELKAAGLIDYSESMTTLYGSLRQLLVDRYPNRSDIFRNLSDEAIRQKITDQFKADRLIATQ